MSISMIKEFFFRAFLFFFNKVSSKSTILLIRQSVLSLKCKSLIKFLELVFKILVYLKLRVFRSSLDNKSRSSIVCLYYRTLNLLGISFLKMNSEKFNVIYSPFNKFVNIFHLNRGFVFRQESQP